MLNSKKQILMVTRPICYPWNEASKNFAWELAQRIEENNFHLLTYKKLHQKKSNIKEHPIYTSPDLQLSLNQKIKLLKFLLNLPLEINILHFLFTPSFLTTAILKNIILPKLKIKKNKQIKTIQTIATLNFSKINKGNWKSYLFADKIITHSEYSKTKLTNLQVPNVTCIKPGIDLKKFQYRPKNKQLLKKIGIEEKDRVILYPGEYIRLGATSKIIKALVQLAKRFDSFKFIFACRLKSQQDLEKKNKIQKKIAELGLANKVIYLETYPKMEDLYNLADILIFPIEKMTGKFDLPLTILEAMASGLPTIISEIEPLIETARYPDSALILREGSAEELSSKILKILQNKKLENKLRTNARKNTESFFNIEDCIDQYKKLYREI
jgi:glycosyltransferase involved in cell wall biosynthesis